MKKNGFIATSILYSFFLIFLTLFIGLVANYLHNRILLAKVNQNSREMLDAINNTKLTDMKLGDHIRFSCNSDFLNSDAEWTLAKKEVNGSEITLYYISDLTAQNIDVFYKSSRTFDQIKKPHPMSVMTYEELIAQNEYTNAINYNKYVSDSNRKFKIEIVTSDFLKEIRDDNSMNKIVKDAILNPGGDYLVKIPNEITGVGYDGINNKTQNVKYNKNYYQIKRYNFSQGDQQLSLIDKYCGSHYDGSNISYYSSNTFGYSHVVEESNSVNTKYIDYCYYASPIAYNHPESEFVVQIKEARDSDEVDSYLTQKYKFRLVAKITLNTSQTNTYIIGGKGTLIDPYLFTKGAKQS